MTTATHPKAPGKVRAALTEVAVDQLMKIAARGAKKDPDKTLRRMLKLAKTFTKDKVWSNVVDGVLARLDAGHPAMGIARKYLTQLNSRCRSLLTRNLFVRETLLGAEKRHAMEDELGYYPPSTFVISPSMYCPLKCYGCYAGEYDPSESLSFEEVDRIIEQAKEIGIQFVVFSGGEPYAWEPLLDIFEKHDDVAFQTFTSGMFFDDDMVQRITDLGNVFPAISCEGFEEETDRRRGKGAFKKVVHAMERLRDNGVFVTFSATATSLNLDVITDEKFIDFWIDKGCMVGWYFSYIPIGRKPALELMPTPEQRVQLSRRLKRIRETKEIFVIDFWNDGEHTRGCIAGGRKYFHINNKGDVEPCVFCHFATDNIRETPLRDALNSPLFRNMRARQPYHEDCRRPCIVIDNPHQLRELVAETGAHGTHPGAESLITDFADRLDQYAAEFGEALKDGPVSTFKTTV